MLVSSGGGGSFCSTDPHVADYRPLATSRPLTGLPGYSTTALQPGRAHGSRSEEATAGKRPREGSAGASGRSARARSQETRAPCPTLTHSHFTIFGCLDFSKISGARVLVRCDSGAGARGLAAPPPAVRGHEARQRLGHCCTGSGQRPRRCPGAQGRPCGSGGCPGHVTRTSLRCTFLGKYPKRAQAHTPTDTGRRVQPFRSHQLMAVSQVSRRLVV